MCEVQNDKLQVVLLWVQEWTQIPVQKLLNSNLEEIPNLLLSIFGEEKLSNVAYIFMFDTPKLRFNRAEPLPNKKPWTIDVPLVSIDKSKSIEEISVENYFKLVHVLFWDRLLYASLAKKITMASKMTDAAPYNVFFNIQPKRPETENQLYSLDFTDLLCPSLGKLKSSFHIMYMASPWWILSKYASRGLHKTPITILHSCNFCPWPKDSVMKELYPNFNYFFVPMKDAVGIHHSKLSIFRYEDDSLRVYVGTANLFSSDWGSSNNSMWISPRCPKLPVGSPASSGESPTGFRSALLQYLSLYRKFQVPGWQSWFEAVKNADFSDVKVVLIYSQPGVHFPIKKNGCSVYTLGYTLSQDCVIPAPREVHDDWPVVAQTMSIGKIGATPEEWLTTHFLKSLESNVACSYEPKKRYPPSNVKFNIVFASKRNLPEVGDTEGFSYASGLRDLQRWLQRYMCQWKADATARSGTFTHAKTYCRLSPCNTKMAYLFLSSSNLSRSGWGTVPSKNFAVYIRSYEIGVLFLPKYFGEEYFEVMDTSNRKNRRLFPLMFDLPLTPYLADDVPFGEVDPETDSSEVDSAMAELQISDESAILLGQMSN